MLSAEDGRHGKDGPRIGDKLESGMFDQPVPRCIDLQHLGYRCTRVKVGSFEAAMSGLVPGHLQWTKLYFHFHSSLHDWFRWQGFTMDFVLSIHGPACPASAMFERTAPYTLMRR
jgi:hypothetical protein